MLERYSGNFDAIEGRTAHGWAVSDDGQKSLVDVFIDDEFQARICADQFRKDLERQGYQAGFAAFSFEIPEAFCDGRSHVIDIRHPGTDLSLVGSPRTFEKTKSETKFDEKRRWCNQNIVFEADTDAPFIRSVKTRRKLAIFSTYHELDRFLAYHRAILKSLTGAGFSVLVVHAAGKYRSGLASIDIPDCFVVLKRNIGYDFGSYATGVFAAFETLPLVDELILVNDSVLQIVDDLASMISRFRALGADVVSCTDSFEREYHLQSYMLWCGPDVCRSGFLPKFMSNYSFTSNKDVVINEGEIGLSRALLAAGFRIQALFNYEAVASTWIRGYDATCRLVRDLPGLPTDWPGASFKKALLERLDAVLTHVLSGVPMNSSHFFWDTLVEEFACPFVKRELIIGNPCNVPTYFKLATHLMDGSDVESAFLELRRNYGGNLVVTSIPPRQPVSSERRQVLANDQSYEPLDPALRLFQHPEITGVVARIGSNARTG